MGTTDRDLYEKALGYRPGQSKARLSNSGFEEIESVLPCPHNPAELGHLYLEGQSKLQLEAASAKKGKHLMILNVRNANFNGNAKLQKGTCLIEQDEDSEVLLATPRYNGF